MLSSIGALLSEGANIVWFMTVLPVVCGLLCWILRKSHVVRTSVAVIYSVINLIFALGIYQSEGFYKTLPFASFGMDMAVNTIGLPSLFLVFTAASFLIAALYSGSALRGKKYSGIFSLYMYIGLAMTNGAIISDNLNMMLFFFEGLLCILFGMLLLKDKSKPATAVKAVVSSAVAILMLMFGVIVTVHSVETPFMAKISMESASWVGFICMIFGAAGMMGIMPFHSWITDASEDSPSAFMVTFPMALQRIIGMYLAIRIVKDIYKLQAGSAMSTAVIVLGAISAVFAGFMALIQKNAKRMLSYCAVGQSGLMLMGVGTALPAGIAGGMLQMLVSSAALMCLYMITENIEARTGTANLVKMGGIAKSMPMSAVCFAVCGLAIIGMPPFGSFFAGTMIYEAASTLYAPIYAAAFISTFITAIYMLKAWRSIFAGETKLMPVKNEKTATVIEVMIPAVVTALICLILGITATGLVKAAFYPALAYADRSGLHYSVSLLILTASVALAAADHFYGFGRSGSSSGATDHIRNLPGLRSIFNAAEKKQLDPYNWLTCVAKIFGEACVFIEKGVSWFYDVGMVDLAKGTGTILQRINDGSLSRYLIAAIGGVVGIAVIFMIVLL
jgi:NADH-quinone oxidoreductase subunit L